MNGLELLTDGLFLPLSLHASFTDIRRRAISSSTELLLLICGFAVIVVRTCLSGIGDPLTLILCNSLPLVLLLMGSASGRTGFGDFEYALAMALFYPCLGEASSFAPLRGIFEPIRIVTSVLAVALINAILIAWLIIFAMDVSKWFKGHKLHRGGVPLAAALAIPILIPRSLLLTPFLSKIAHRGDPPNVELPLIPLLFLGFLAARFAHVILM
jgi:hypothetical protein